MHKSSIGTRFTIASKQRVIKPLNKYITAPFKLFCKSMEKFYNKNFSQDLIHFGRFKTKNLKDS